MNIDDLTLGQIKEIQSLLGESAHKQTNSIPSKYIGKYVIVRSRNEGLNAGFVVDANESGIILSEARRIWYHEPKDKSLSWYEGVAESGLSNDSKISCCVLSKAIVEDYSITQCTTIAKDSIREMKSHDQN